MGRMIALAREDSPEHAAAMDELKDAMIMVMAKRLGGNFDITVAELDDLGQDLLSFALNEGVFHFQIEKKQCRA